MYGWRPITQILPPMNMAVQLLIYNPTSDTHHVSAGVLVEQIGGRVNFSFLPVAGVLATEALPVVAWADLNHPDTNIRN